MASLTFQQLLDGIERIASKIEPNSEDEYPLSPDERRKIVDLLQQYQTKLVDYQSYIFFDESGYTKNLVKSFGKACNVIIMCWAPGQASALHAHEGSRCFVKVLEGELNEIQVPHPAHLECSESRQKKVLHKDNIRYLDDSIGMHQVTNASNTERAITLHVYLPAYTKCRIFDTMDDPTLELSRTIDVTFTSKFGIQL